ncbi:MAG TPA: hypothetical protein VFJ71_11770, partial [Candidatus Limnocylindrales bacterium]|nr:hypothetical protein [Candidatus Limnocylindrales bacterium]
VKSGQSVEASRPKTAAARLAAANRSAEARIGTAAAVAVEPSGNGREAVGMGRSGRAVGDGPVRD